MLSAATALNLTLRHSMIDRGSYLVRSFPSAISACDEGPGVCAYLITFCSIVLILVTLPASLCFAVKVVQEYERVVIFRLGRLLSGGARGPGIFFIVPCVDSYQKVDMRTLTFDVPPQEVRKQASQSQVSQAQEGDHAKSGWMGCHQIREDRRLQSGGDDRRGAGAPHLPVI